MRGNPNGKPDANQAVIVQALRSSGCGVCVLSGVGGGVPDLLVHAPVAPWRMVLLEVKDGAKPPSARKLNPDQVVFHGAWRGPLYVVTSVDEALAAVGLWTMQADQG